MAGGKLNPAELAGIAVKSVGWSFFTGALGFGTASITANLALVTKVYFPREVLPLSTVLTQTVDSTIGAIAVALIIPWLGVGLHWSLLWLPLLLGLLILLTTGVTLIAACGNVFFRDAKHLVQIVVSFGIFFTPVFFRADTFGPRGARYMLINPLGPILEGLRLAVVEGHNLLVPIVSAGGTLAWSPWFLAWSAGWAVFGTLAAAVIFHRAEFAFAEYV
jgi:ABC-type polysaccharide/polyol phosphate export permease